jgi:hypothetical protein
MVYNVTERIYDHQIDTTRLELNDKYLESIAADEDNNSIGRSNSGDITSTQSCFGCLVLLAFSVGTLTAIGYGVYKAVQYFSE